MYLSFRFKFSSFADFKARLWFGITISPFYIRLAFTNQLEFDFDFNFVSYL
jgi:hypothetical protein